MNPKLKVAFFRSEAFKTQGMISSSMAIAAAHKRASMVLREPDTDFRGVLPQPAFFQRCSTPRIPLPRHPSRVAAPPSSPPAACTPRAISRNLPRRPPHRPRHARRAQSQGELDGLLASKDPSQVLNFGHGNQASSISDTKQLIAHLSGELDHYKTTVDEPASKGPTTERRQSASTSSRGALWGSSEQVPREHGE